MKKIEVFDASMRCSIGICNMDINQKLVTFATDGGHRTPAGTGLSPSLRKIPMYIQKMMISNPMTIKGGLSCLLPY